MPRKMTAGGVVDNSNPFSKLLDLIELYNAEKLRLDILKAKHKHVQQEFMGSYDRFRNAQRKVLEIQTELTETEKELKDAEKETLEMGAATREADKEMKEAVELLKDAVDKMGKELEMVKRTL